MNNSYKIHKNMTTFNMREVIKIMTMGMEKMKFYVTKKKSIWQMITTLKVF